MDDMAWELQLVAAMKSDDDNAWREFSLAYWLQIDDDMEKSLLKRNLPNSYAAQAADYAIRSSKASCKNIKAMSLDGVYRYVRVVGLNWIRRNAQSLIPLPVNGEEQLPSISIDSDDWESLEPYAQAMDWTYDALNRQHRELTALAWADALDILALYMKEEHRNIMVLTWGKAFEYLIDHPEVLGRDKVHFDDIRDLRVRHIAAIYSIDPANLSQILWRAKDTFKKCLDRFL